MRPKILVPLDGSKTGESALPCVEEPVSKLSPEVKTEVTLIHVVSSLTHYAVAGEAGEDLISKGANVKIKGGTGKAAEAIAKAAYAINADLIAMSTHGRSGINRWAFGSVTGQGIQRGGNRPVLLVRAPKEHAQT